MPSFSFRINPSGSYLSNKDFPAGSTTPIPPARALLSELGLKSGDIVSFLSRGGYKAGEFGFADLSPPMHTPFFFQ